jgi:hypothetical protein
LGESVPQKTAAVKKVLFPGQEKPKAASGVQTSLKPIWKLKMAVQTMDETNVAIIWQANVYFGGILV